MRASMECVQSLLEQCTRASEVLINRNKALHKEQQRAHQEVHADAPALSMKLGTVAPFAAEARPCDLEMVLDTSMSEVLLQEDDFRKHVAADISHAAGCDASKVEVMGIDAGSIIRRADGKGFLLCGTRVKVGLAHDAGESRLEVAKELERQAGDTDSPLMQGRLTRKCRGVRVTADSNPGRVAELQAQLQALKERYDEQTSKFGENKKRLIELEAELEQNTKDVQEASNHVQWYAIACVLVLAGGCLFELYVSAWYMFVSHGSSL
jgi:hypothetical protein